MSGAYDDILYLPHHVSPTRQPMSMHDRAAQFSPFAALTGHEAAIQETARLTDAQIQLDMDGIPLLDAQIRRLAEQLPEHPEISAVYFVQDEKKPGGAYVSITGKVRNILPLEQAILMEDGQRLYFDWILQLDMEST